MVVVLASVCHLSQLVVDVRQFRSEQEVVSFVLVIWVLFVELRQLHPQLLGTNLLIEEVHDGRPLTFSLGRTVVFLHDSVQGPVQPVHERLSRCPFPFRRLVVRRRDVIIDVNSFRC